MQNSHKGRSGLDRLIRAWQYSLAGLREAYSGEQAFRQEVLLAMVLVPLALWLGSDAGARALMVGSVLLVLMVELLNSAIEATVDRVSLEDHPLAKRAKDVSSAAVLVSLVNVVLVWGILLW